MTKKNERYLILAIVACLFISGVYINYKNKKALSCLKANASYTNATVVRFNEIAKFMDASIVYDFKVGAKKYTGDKTYSQINKFKGDAFIGQTFLVVYSNKDPRNNQILITEDDYMQFRMQYPDTLLWTKKYFFD
ncbi:MAG: hypothetical protein V4649_06815 [Bacteroidota bacterium]